MQSYQNPQLLPNLTPPPSVIMPFHPQHFPLLDQAGVEYSVMGVNEMMLDYMDIVIACDASNCLALIQIGIQLERRNKS